MKKVLFIIGFLFLSGCVNESKDVVYMLVIKGRVHKVYPQKKFCTIIIRGENNMIVSIVSKDFSNCKELKKNDLVSATLLINPSIISGSEIEKIKPAI
ncbi:hypothetical protein GW950_00620 [Candidatus Wolfebacteria bacterium]|nr:hypothetical protein [Candidatus Wolfebacteria bacterium]